MASVSTNAASGNLFANAFNAVMGAVENYFKAYIEAQGRVSQIDALESKSDAELADMGLKRDDIVRHVFRDKFYA